MGASTKPDLLHAMTKMDAHNFPFAITSLNFIRTSFNFWISWDFVFQTNSDFISNSNLNSLPHPYISSGAPPAHPSKPILPQNRTLAATLSSTTSPVPLVAATPVLKSSLQIKRRVGREKPMT
jgi:hypothetical protein